MHRKPIHVPAEPGGQALQFNVSHHGSLVALVGCSNPDVKVGTDVAMVSWDRDYPKVMEEGFSSWSQSYNMVFS